MRTLYFESSALIRGLINDEPDVGKALAAFPVLVTSSLTITEVERALIRLVLAGKLSPEERTSKRAWFRAFLDTCGVLDLSRDVVHRAAMRFPVEFVRSLDALHLASAALYEERLGAPTAILSTDRRVRENALAMGFSVVPAASTASP